MEVERLRQLDKMNEKLKQRTDARKKRLAEQMDAALREKAEDVAAATTAVASDIAARSASGPNIALGVMRAVSRFKRLHDSPRKAAAGLPPRPASQQQAAHTPSRSTPPSAAADVTTVSSELEGVLQRIERIEASLLSLVERQVSK